MSGNIKELAQPKGNNSIKCPELITYPCTLLTHRELEDLYLATSHANIELKKTINDLLDKVKILKTRLRRMEETQTNGLSKERKDCCASTRALLQDKISAVEELMNANNQLMQKNRILNTRLNSMKQFSKQSNSSGCKPFSSGKQSSSRSLNRENPSRGSAEATNKDVEKAPSTTSSRRENSTHVHSCTHESRKKSYVEVSEVGSKYKIQIEELKERVVELTQKLTKAQSDCNERILELEQQITELEMERRTLRMQLSTTEQNLTVVQSDRCALAELLRETEAKCAETEMELTFAKKKVMELETQMKFAQWSAEVNKVIKHHEGPFRGSRSGDRLPTYTGPKPSEVVDDSKTNDDSGFTDPKESPNKEKPEQSIDLHIVSEISDSLPGISILNPDTSIDKEPQSQSIEKFNQNKSAPKIEETIRQLPEKKLSTSRSRLKTSFDDEQPPTLLAEAFKLNVVAQDTRKEAQDEKRHDSGFDDVRRNKFCSDKLCHEILQKLTDLQKQMDALKLAADNNQNKNSSKSSQNSTNWLEINASDHPKKRKVSVDRDNFENKRKSSDSEEPIVTRDMQNDTESCHINDAENQVPEKRIFERPEFTETDSERILADKHKLNISEEEDMDRARLVSKFDSHNDSIMQIPGPLLTHHTIIDDKKPTGPITKNEKKLTIHGQEKKRVSLDLPRGSNNHSYADSKDKGGHSLSRYVKSKGTELSIGSIKTRFRQRNLFDGTLNYDRAIEAVPLPEETADVPQDPKQLGAQADPTTFQMNPPTPGNTYNINELQAVVKCEQTPSPDNTDYEISSIVDTSTYGKLPSPVLSPGEGCGYSTTYSSTFSPYVDNANLSDGEIPVCRAGTKLSLGEKPASLSLGEKPAPLTPHVEERKEAEVQVSNREQVEAALQSITEELQRCKMLLQNNVATQRPEVTRLPNR